MELIRSKRFLKKKKGLLTIKREMRDKDWKKFFARKREEAAMRQQPFIKCEFGCLVHGKKS